MTPPGGSGRPRVTRPEPPRPGGVSGRVRGAGGSPGGTRGPRPPGWGVRPGVRKLPDPRTLGPTPFFLQEKILARSRALEVR